MPRDTVRYRLQEGISARRGEREGVLSKGDGLVICPSLIEMEGQKVRDLSQATRVVEGHRKGLGLAQARQDAPRVPRRQEGIMQDEPEIDGLLTLIPCLRQMWEGTECLLEIPRSLAVGRLRYGLVPGLSAVCQGFVPHLTPQGMVREALDMFGEAVPGGCLQSLNDACVQPPPPLL
jgi:hypothetical protein